MARFCGDVVEIWVIGAAFRGCHGGVSVIEHIKGGFHARRGVHEAFIVTREGQSGIGACEGKGRKGEERKGKENGVKYVTVV